MACRNVILGLMLAVAASLGGCNTYNGFRRDLGVDPVDPPRQILAQGDTTVQPAVPPKPPQQASVAGDISQASWAAERAAYYTPQTNTVPVDYRSAPAKMAEDKAAQAPAGQPMPLKPGAVAAPQTTPKTMPGAVVPAAASARPVLPQSKPAAYASAADTLPTGGKPSAIAMDRPAGKSKMKAAAASVAPETLGKMMDKPAADGLWRVHLASHRTEWAAISEWQELLKHNPKLYSQFDPKIEWVDLKDRGSFARLLAGGWADRKAADAACAKIRGPRRYCAAMKD